MTIMQRRKTPAGAEKRRKVKHVYTLRFDNGPDQIVKAVGPTQAVAARKGERLPYQITDETLVNLWLTAGRRERAEKRMAEKLPAPVYADPDDAPVRRFARMKDTTGGASV